MIEFLKYTTDLARTTLGSEYLFIRRGKDEDGVTCLIFCAYSEGHVARMLGYYYDKEQLDIEDIAFFGNLDYLNALVSNEFLSDAQVKVVQMSRVDPKENERTMVTNIDFKSKEMKATYQAADPWNHRYTPISKLPVGEPVFSVDLDPSVALKFNQAKMMQDKLGTQPNQAVLRGNEEGVWAEFGRTGQRGTRVLVSEDAVEEYDLPIRSNSLAKILNWATAGQRQSMLVASRDGVVIGAAEGQFLIDINCPPLVIVE